MRPRPARKPRKPRRTWRERLRSELWRHLFTGVIAGILVVALMAVLLFTTAVEVEGSGVDSETTAMTVLSAYAFYGPAYFVLSRFAWAGISGDRLRAALARTTLPDKGLVRSYLVGSPTQIASMAALLSLIAVWILAIRPGAPFAALLISLACVCGSWILVMATFSVEYAREWANSDGFRFAGDEERTYGDFVYLAVVASTTYSSSDVSTMNRRARNLVTIHSATAFVFGTVILAFLVALVLNTVSG